MTDEDRHADEVNIAFQMGADWERDRMKARIEMLEAALRKISQQNTLWGAICKAKHALGDFDRKALEGKDD